MTAKRDKGISEAASGKRKWERPPVFAPSFRAAMNAICPDIKTRRRAMESFYRKRAINVLAKDGGTAWLADEAKMKAASGGWPWKPSILSELGRIPNEEDLRFLAGSIYVLKPKTKDAVSLIRRYRTVKGEFDNYLERHPGADVEGSLLTVLDKVQEASVEERRKE